MNDLIQASARIERIFFFVEGVPVPKPVGPQHYKTGGTSASRRYWAWKKEIIRELRKKTTDNLPVFPKGPIKLTCAIRVPIPKSWTKKKRREAAKGKVLPTSKPDLKNYIAGIEDAINDVAWKDDAQVCFYGPSHKIYGQKPGVIVTVEIIEA